MTSPSSNWTDHSSWANKPTFFLPVCWTQRNCSGPEIDCFKVSASFSCLSQWSVFKPIKLIFRNLAGFGTWKDANETAKIRPDNPAESPAGSFKARSFQLRMRAVSFVRLYSPSDDVKKKVIEMKTLQRNAGFGDLG